MSRRLRRGVVGEGALGVGVVDPEKPREDACREREVAYGNRRVNYIDKMIIFFSQGRLLNSNLFNA